MLPSEKLRWRCRRGEFNASTAGLAPGYVQANLVVLPADWAEDFQEFCDRNPKPCPLLERLDPGCPEPRRLATEADLRTDLPRYRVFRCGELDDEPTSVEDYWREDLVAFLLGCSFSFEDALMKLGIPMRHVDEGVTVPMYSTRISCAQAGRFAAPLVVSMRPILRTRVDDVVRLTAQWPLAHGAPIHHGDPATIGIRDLSRPDWGQPITVNDDETPVFWACGVTPQLAIAGAQPPLAITHSPGAMFVSDLEHADLLEMAGPSR